MIEKARELWGAVRVFGGGAVAMGLGYGNMAFDWLQSGWAFRYLYSPLLGTLGLVFFVLGFFLVADVVLPNWKPLDIKKKPRDDGPPCPKCGLPLRTEEAKQCRHCGADWH